MHIHEHVALCFRPSFIILFFILKDIVTFGVNLDVTSYFDGEKETHTPNGRALPVVVWDFYKVSNSFVSWLRPNNSSEIISNFSACLHLFSISEGLWIREMFACKGHISKLVKYLFGLNKKCFNLNFQHSGMLHTSISQAFIAGK